MHRSKWRRLLIFILLLMILVSAAGCQQVKNIDRYGHSIASIPERIGQGVINLLGGIGNVGRAIGNQVGNIINNMTGR